jgi:Xaa-Pro dipeptidase
VGHCVADDVVSVNWYDGISHPKTSRALSLLPEVDKRFPGAFIHDRIDTNQGVEIHKVISKLRRKKYSDEISLIKRSAQIAEKAHAWVLENIAPGMTELDVYSEVQKICTAHGGQPLIVYGDFAVSPGPERKGGPPTQRKLKESDMFILDFSVVLFGYRSDFTNTLVVGKKPSSSQQQLMDLARLAMEAGENNLLEGVNASHVYQSVMDVFLKAGLGDHFPHHAGHGLGLSHPEAPFIVPGSDEILVAGDVITLEPGLYVPNVGGLRIERNYLITESGFECLTHHNISLV